MNGKTKSLIIGIIISPLLMFGTWSMLQGMTERNRSYSLMADVNEIQWRSYRIREDFVKIHGLLILAQFKNSTEFNEQIIENATFLSVDASSLLSQSFLKSLLTSSDIKYIESIESFADILIPSKAEAKQYTELLDHMAPVQKEIWRITTTVSNTIYVKTRMQEHAKDASLINFAYALFIAVFAIATYWILLTYISKSQYNDQVRKFSLLFSHMTVTRINALNLWANDSLSADETPDPVMLEKARKRLDYLTTVAQWLSRIAYPIYNAKTSNLMELRHVLNDHRIKSENINPVFDITEDAAATKVPEAHLHLILQELISNAQDALNNVLDPKITVRAFIKGSALLGRYLCISVEDNGPGMNKAQLAKAVSPFYSSKGEAFGHSGLGLYGCIGMIRSMRGKFQITSIPGKGTRMTILYPASKKN
jgi:signal transduction histidine kinase